MRIYLQRLFASYSTVTGSLKVHRYQGCLKDLLKGHFLVISWRGAPGVLSILSRPKIRTNASRQSPFDGPDRRRGEGGYHALFRIPSEMRSLGFCCVQRSLDQGPW
ncbi:hypothetical protein CDAR_515711 [Caerostris darwini]|uniref:Uncharacterized protein n=1 Tax=Caerostris darwini TaxID=1538125 RepID=A0AAV4S5U6_9ARAC|nr:hypothetical protein CDAR_515711 [Caerostris darwini]